MIDEKVEGEYYIYKKSISKIILNKTNRNRKNMNQI
jgi:hypothetical protein